MRHIATIPVFSPYSGTGWGYDVASKKMMGDYTWGDVHHPGLSQTESEYDGRWLFVNDNANNRVARIDLRDFKTKEILGPIPNSMGNHGSSFVTENTEYILVSTRFSVPLPKGRVADPKDYASQFNGMVSGIKSTRRPVTCRSAADSDAAVRLGSGLDRQGPEQRLGVWTSYNTEMAHNQLETNASQLDRDLAAVVIGARRKKQWQMERRR